MNCLILAHPICLCLAMIHMNR